MTQPHSQRGHAKLAPSASHRWMECPGSVAASEGMPNKSSVFAAEGTSAHELAAHCLEMNVDPSTFIGMWIDIHPADKSKWLVDLDEPPVEDDRFFEITEEMAEAVEAYCTHIRALLGPDDLMTVEQKLDMTHLHPSIWGTGDASVLQVEKKHLHICDLKYGRGVAVDATDNPQMLLYAAGTLRRYHNHLVDRLTVHIIQPRAPYPVPMSWQRRADGWFMSPDRKSAMSPEGSIRTFELDLIELLEFEMQIEQAAKATEAPDAPRKAGEWCMFCPAQPVCPTRREQVYADALAEFEELDLMLRDPETMSKEELAKIVRNADAINTYVKSVQKYAHDLACRGEKIPGMKLVAKRALRKWRDEDAAQEILLVYGASKDEIFTEPKLRSPAQLEKLFPGKNKQQRQEAMAELVEAKSSGVNLVPEDDRRPAVEITNGEEFAELEQA